MIQTERLRIRTFLESDSNDLYEYLSLPETYLFEPGEPVSLSEAEELSKERSASGHFLAVVLKSEGKMIGHLYFSRIPPEQFLTWELGYIFNPKYHHHGYATEAATALIHRMFGKPDVRRVVANCNVENIASWKLLERIGMRREGHFLKKGFFRTDADNEPAWFDAYQYAILEEEAGIG